MFYQESYNCTMYESSPKIVEDMDYFIGTLRREEARLITISRVSSKLEIPLEIAHFLLKYYTDSQILQKRYLIVCPTCGYNIKSFDKKSEAEMSLTESHFCMECEENIICNKNNICIAYARIKMNTTSQEEINKTLIEHRLIEEIVDEEENFFSKADSLEYSTILKQAFKCDESAYIELEKMYKNLDNNFKTSKEKGDAYEKLVIDVVNRINGVKATSIVKTNTNQIDCFAISQVKTTYHSIYDYLSPKFIGECKNEQETPGITYAEKLYSLIKLSPKAKLGILFSRKKWSKESKEFAKKMALLENIYIVNFCDDDWEKFLNQKMNFLEILLLKIVEVEMYFKEKIDLVQEFSKEEH